MLILKRKHYPLEYILGVLRILATFAGPFMILEFIILYWKYHREGFRVNIFIYLMALLLSPFIQIASIVITLGFMIMARKLTNYQLPSGGPPVGHLHFKSGWLNNYKNLPEIAIYYPADIQRGDKCGLQWLKVKDYALRMEDTAKKDLKRRKNVPLLFFQVVVSQFYKFKVHVYPRAKISKSENNQKYPIVILSPGLASHCDGYSVIARHLAQQNYIVIIPEHIENIRNIYHDNEQNRVYRQGQLKDRVITIKSILDIIHDDSFFASLFISDSPVQADKANVSIVGHSFGGTTCLAVIQEDSRITGACVMYDPCLYVFADGHKYDQCKVPIISINADDFYRRLYPFMNNDQRLLQLFDTLPEDVKKHSIQLYIKDQQHADFSDIPIIWHGESGLYSISKKIHEVHLRFGLILTLTSIFLQKKKSQVDELKSIILKAADEVFPNNSDLIRF